MAQPATQIVNEKQTYTYEAMFLISQAVASDLNSVVEHINEILHRGHATLLAMRKWDERRLAYEIKGQKRGLYILAYFTTVGENIAHIERDCNLSEKILRAMILRCDHMTKDQIEAADDRKGLEVEARLRSERAASPAAAAAVVTEASSEEGEESSN
ncbi:MAG: 30S ribosomal protein S6 [Phycisphaerales bacterium]